jgi:hypothetical protein
VPVSTWSTADRHTRRAVPLRFSRATLTPMSVTAWVGGLSAVISVVALAWYLFGPPRTVAALVGWVVFLLVIGYVGLGCIALLTVHRST